MPRYTVLFDSQRSGSLSFDADDEDHAHEIYEMLMGAETYPDELDNPHENVDSSDLTYYELTTSSGKHIAE